MTDTARLIAARLESCFVSRGFLEPGVDALRDAAGVSLRTLYKYFPSREAMVIGALDHRRNRPEGVIEVDRDCANSAQGLLTAREWLNIAA